MTYRVKQLSTGRLFAAKELEKSKLGTDYNAPKFQEEVRLQALRNSSLFGVVHHEKEVCCHHGCLKATLLS